VLEPGVLERDGSEPGVTGPGAKAPGAIERGVTQPESIEPRAAEPEAKAPSNPPVAAAIAPAGVDIDRPGEEARALIATMRAPNADEDLDTVFRKAGEFLKWGRMADAHLLYFFAARRGHAPAAFVLAGLYDPVRFDKGRSLLGRPDPVQALKWYRVAADQGEGEAQTRLRALESWVDAKARAGDAEALRLRLSWR
jgi:TPR repeat protein